jgi:hypothetical protein
MSMSQTVDIPPELKTRLEKFRFTRKKSGDGHAALVVKVNKKKLIIEEDAYHDSISIEDLAEDLPEMNPRYVIVSYELRHKDGRVSFPLVLINWVPEGSETGILMLHASTFIKFQDLTGIAKVIEIRDGVKSLTTESLDKALL